MTLKRILIFALLFLILMLPARAQVHPGNFQYHWQHSGTNVTSLPAGKILNVVDAGADSFGNADCSRIADSLIQIAKSGDTIYFPAGTYLFRKAIILRDSICICGTGIQSRLLLNLNAPSSGLVMAGSVQKNLYYLNQSLYRKRNYFTGAGGSISAGQYLQVKQNDSGLVTSDWARNTVSEIIKVLRVSHDTVYFDPPLKTDYPLQRKPQLIFITPRTGITIKCLSIIRRDSTLDQNSNISLSYSVHCLISSVRSQNCNYSHIEINNSAWNSITGSDFSDAYGYGSGGKGYGIALQYGSCENRIENNYFHHLRHSVLLQAGCNGNVIAYNYSVNPFWTETGLPSNSAGDMVLHGNYPFANLFEGNTCQNIVIDNTHGINGPANTFFRNRALLYGIFMNSGPASDSQVFINNEIVSAVFLQGLYLLAGTGHLEQGNLVKGNYKPDGSKPATELSWFLKQAPVSYWPSGMPWPYCGDSSNKADSKLPVQNRLQQGVAVWCGGGIPSAALPPLATPDLELSLFPNPAHMQVAISGNFQCTELHLLRPDGTMLRKVKKDKSGMTWMNLQGVPAGIYFIQAGPAVQKLMVE